MNTQEREALIAEAQEYLEAECNVSRYPILVEKLLTALQEAVQELARKHPEPEITDAEVARLHGVIAEVRKAWWTATDYNDAGNVIYTDSVESAMDSIWTAIAEETLGVPFGEGETR